MRCVCVCVNTVWDLVGVNKKLHWIVRPRISYTLFLREDDGFNVCNLDACLD